MFRSRYSMTLTIVLIVVIIAIIGLAIFFSIRAYTNYKEEKDMAQAIVDFDKFVIEEKTKKDKQEDEQTDIDIESQIIQTVDLTSDEEQSQGGTGSTGRPRTKMFKNYPMAGYIEIPKTGLKCAILLDISPAALDVSVGVMYPSNPKLNEPGNTVIIGHNYKNGKFFSNNKKLVLGDKIKISYERITLKQAVLIGMSQALAAAFPGVSRSGITITTARYLKVDRKSAAKFSFLLAMPITFAAVIFDLPHFTFDLNLLLGIVSSFAVGMLVIRFLLKYLQNGSYKAFAAYRVLIGILVIFIYIKKIL